MYIERNGRKYKLTAEELLEASSEFATNWMKNTLENDFNVPEELSGSYAEWAYKLYCKGDDETQYECLEKAYAEYEKDKKENSDAFGNDEELPKATCCNCYAYNNGYCDKFQGAVDADDDCNHIHGETIEKVYALGSLMGFFDKEKLTEEELAKKLGYGADDLRIMDTI